VIGFGDYGLDYIKSPNGSQRKSTKKKLLFSSWEKAKNRAGKEAFSHLGGCLYRALGMAEKSRERISSAILASGRTGFEKPESGSPKATAITDKISIFPTVFQSSFSSQGREQG
jgi:hypothetical protein